MELVVNFSGGKDSSAMLAFLCENYPHVTKHVIFADTGWEHKGTIEWCTKLVHLISNGELSLKTTRNERIDFLSMVREREMFPGMKARQCTSALKRDPIIKWIRNNVKDPVVINAMGLRSEESAVRDKKPKLARSVRDTNGVRTVWEWSPIKDWTEGRVLAYLMEKNIPLHPVYKYLRRFSCRMCIYMKQEDITAVKLHDPEAYEIIATLEREINFSMFNGMYLDNRPEQLTIL